MMKTPKLDCPLLHHRTKNRNVLKSCTGCWSWSTLWCTVCSQLLKMDFHVAHEYPHPTVTRSSHPFAMCYSSNTWRRDGRNLRGGGQSFRTWRSDVGSKFALSFEIVPVCRIAPLWTHLCWCPWQHWPKSVCFWISRRPIWAGAVTSTPTHFQCCVWSVLGSSVARTFARRFFAWRPPQLGLNFWKHRWKGFAAVRSDLEASLEKHMRTIKLDIFFDTCRS